MVVERREFKKIAGFKIPFGRTRLNPNSRIRINMSEKKMDELYPINPRIAELVVIDDDSVVFNIEGVDVLHEAPHMIGLAKKEINNVMQTYEMIDENGQEFVITWKREK